MATLASHVATAGLRKWDVMWPCDSSRLEIFGSRHSFFKSKSPDRFASNALPKSANCVKRILPRAFVLDQCLEFATFKQTRKGDVRQSEQRTRTKPVGLPLCVGHFLVF